MKDGHLGELGNQSGPANVTGTGGITGQQCRSTLNIDPVNRARDTRGVMEKDTSTHTKPAIAKDAQVITLNKRIVYR